MAKKKPKQKRRAAAAAELTQEEAREELLALEAIFDEDIAPVHNNQNGSLGFALRIVPHPGEALANHVAVTLVVSYPDDYPAEELTLKLTDAVGLAETAVRQLSKQLHTAAAQYAADAEVCCFQLVTLAQEYLQQHNCPPDEEAAALVPQSLYEEMLQRDTTAAAAAAAAAVAGADSREQSFRAPVMGDTFFDSLLDGGGLFSDAAELPVGPPGAAGGSAAVPVMEMRAKPGRPPKPPPTTQQQQPSAAASKAAAAAPKAEVGLAPAEADAAPAAGAAASGVASAPPAAAAAAMAAADRQGSLGRSGSGLLRVSVAAAAAAAAVESSGRAGLDGHTSGGGSMLKTIGQSFRAMLPKPLRRYIEGAGATPEGSEAGEAAGPPLAAEDRQLIRQELLLGHLLTLAASSGAVPPHALPSIAGMLQAEGLMPKWLAFTLTQQPALFDRAFHRVFHQELEAAQQEVSGEQDDPMQWAVQRFWKRRAQPLAPSRSVHGHMRSRSGGPPDDSALPSSRYETDFTELRPLGRGGYGVVVAAINRLDGRQYAVKKIPLDAHSAGAYARIMREVTTLSRLQHINVVRYFQAWVEASTSMDDGGSEDGSGDDEWGSDTDTATATATPSSTAGAGPGMLGRAAASGPVAAGGRQLLTPVAEHSREGRASTPSTKGGPTSLLAAASDGSSGSSEGGSEESGGSEEGSGSGSGSGDGSICEEASASFGGAGSSLSANLAVAGANRLLSAHGSDSQLNTRPSSSVDGAFLSAWDSQTESQSGTLSTSAGLSVPGGTSSSGGGAGAAHASLTVSGSGEFTFDRSRPLGAISGGGGVGGGGGGGISTQPSTTATQRSRRSQRGAGHPVQQQVLFIQMEFCPRTVRDVLDSRELDEERRWSILRQILAGLAHIHAQGIIHRDLKPANTFLDSQGNVKLGDFGLAKYNTTDGSGADAAEPSPNLYSAAAAASLGGALAGFGGGGGGGASAALLSDTTGLVGTSYYISPEIREGWASYDAKVDLFSLGVMAFELWHPFATAMERAVLLRDLRENGVMPAAFEAANPVVCKLIRWLLAPNPAERPTAVEVLDEQLTDLLRCLPDNPAMHEKVLDSIFSIPSRLNGSGGAAAAALEAPGAPIPVQMAAREHVLAVLKECFQRHGAVGMCSQELGLADGEVPPGAVQLLTPAGTKLALRWELRQAFAAWFMQQLAASGGGGSLLLDGLRRYEVAAVQRRAAGQGLPRSFLQADLDFVLPGERTTAEQLLGDAEVITATHEALAELPECGEVEVRLGHRTLFDLALLFVGVSRELRGSVIQLLATASVASPLHATARSKRWPSIKAGLEGIGLSAEVIARCRQLVLQAAGEAESALFRLRTLLAHTVAGRHGSSGGGGGGHRAGARPASATAALACLDELQQLVQYLQAWGVPQAALLVDPLLAPHSDAFSGALFQCHLVQGSTGTTAVVAAGGRYDSLLKATWARQSALSGTVAPMPPLHAVGVTLNVDRLVAVAQASSRWRTPGNLPPVAGLPRLSQADVLVCSRGGGGLLKERMALARSLWDAGVSAELLPQAAPSLTEQYEYAQSRGIPWLVIIHASTFEAADTVRVKAMNARLEEDVSVSDLPTYLLNALHPHGSAPMALGSRAVHAAGGRPAVAEDGDAGEQEEPSFPGRRERDWQRRGGRR